MFSDLYILILIFFKGDFIILLVDIMNMLSYAYVTTFMIFNVCRLIQIVN